MNHVGTQRTGVQGAGSLANHKYKSLHNSSTSTHKPCTLPKPIQCPQQRHSLHNSRVEDRRRRLAPSNAAGSTTEAEAETSATVGENGGVPDHFKFTSLDGRWSVRPLNKSNMLEVGTVVQLQTEGFHTPNMIPFLDSLFKNNFKAEVLSEMQKKLKYNPVERYVSLVVESTSMPGQVVGVMEASYIDVKEVLKSLDPGTEWCVYLASMAIDPRMKRQGAAGALLSAAELVAKAWGEQQMVLHVYQDNTPAIQLYKKSGFEVIFQDAPWLAKLAVRPRYLMRKKIDVL